MQIRSVSRLILLLHQLSPLLLIHILIGNNIVLCDTIDFINFSEFEGPKIVEEEVKEKKKKDPDYGALAPKLITSRGYRYEMHHIQSQDGFIIAIHRMTSPLYHHNTLRAPVLCFHSAFASSAYFLNNSPGGDPEEPIFLTGPNLAFELAKRGFDVWLLDQRATIYSKNHTIFDEDDKKNFWNWSNDQIALLDLPAAIDHVTKMTNSTTIGYIGHSLSTQVMFMLMSRRKQYNTIIRPFIALAPTFFNGDGWLSRFPQSLWLSNGMTEAVFGLMGGKLTNSCLRKLIKILCAGCIKRHVICPPVIYISLTINSLMTRFSLESFNIKRLPIYASSWYYTMSKRQAAHSLQIARTNRPAMLDLGPANNVKIYGQEFPPIYDPTLITCPHIVLISSLADLLADQRDVQQLRETMTAKPIFDQVINDASFGHLSFLLGKPEKVIAYVNKPIISILDNLYPWIRK